MAQSLTWNHRNPKTGRFKGCRVAALERADDDPMTAAMGAPMGDFFRDARRRDVQEGCPRCTADVIENASEPDVMQRWGFR